MVNPHVEREQGYKTESNSDASEKVLYRDQMPNIPRKANGQDNLRENAHMSSSWLLSDTATEPPGDYEVLEIREMLSKSYVLLRTAVIGIALRPRLSFIYIA